MADAKKKYLDRFDTDEEMAKAYTELEEKLGKHGATIGEQKKAIAEFEGAKAKYEATIGQYQQFTAQAKPIVDWYTANAPALQQMMQNGGAQAAARQAGSTVPGFNILSAEEQQSVVNQALQMMQERVLTPYTQRLEQGIQKFAAEQREALRAEFAQQNRASTEVLYNAVRRVAPPDKLAELDRLHEMTLKFADPKNYDPTKFATEHMSMAAELEALKSKTAEYEKQLQERERASTGAVSGTAPSLFQDDQKSYASREDRMAATLGKFQETVGKEAYRDFMPTPTGG